MALSQVFKPKIISTVRIIVGITVQTTSSLLLCDKKYALLDFLPLYLNAK